MLQLAVLQLAVTTKGQVTLQQAALDQPDVKPSEKVGVSLLLDGTVELAPVSAGHDLRSVRGLLCRRGQRRATLRDMQDAVRSKRQ